MTKLESAIYLAKQGFRVFPLVANTKLPAIKNFSSLATSDESQIKTWFGSSKDFNIGIATDDLLVVDVDTKSESKNGLATIEKLNAEGKIFPPTTQQVTPTNGMHLLYRAKSPIKNSVSKLGPGLDVRGKGGYIVAMGSTINGVSYKINSRPLCDPPEWLLEACVKDREESSKAHEIAAHVDPGKAWERGIKLLAKLEPVTAGNRNQEAYKAANRLKDIGVNKTDIFMLMLEYWQCEPMLEPNELSHVVGSAFKYGKDAQGSASPEALFQNPLPSEDVKDENHPIDLLNKDYAHILIGGKHSILYETTDAEGNFKTQFLEEQTFHSRLAAQMFQPDGKAPIALSKFWVKHPRRRSYDGLVFKPEIDVSDRFYNMWRGFKVRDIEPDEKITDEMKKAVASFEEHIFTNVADEDTEHFDWVMSWFAHLIQKPWKKPGTAMVLKGKKGVGKNAIFETFRPMFPDHYLVSGDRRYLVSNFNGHLERLLMFVADEAFWSGDKSSEGILKSLITDDRVNIERKGKDTVSIDSCHRIAILGNEKWVVPASHDERRYAIFNMGESRKQDRKFFGEMKINMDAGGTRYLFNKLKNMNITQDVGQIPNTKGLLEQKKESSGILAQWWLDLLSAGFIAGSGFDEDIWPETITFEILRNSFEAYARRRGRDRYLESNRSFNDSLKVMCPSVKIERDKYTLPTIKKARDEWDKYMGHPEEWNA